MDAYPPVDAVTEPLPPFRPARLWAPLWSALALLVVILSGSIVLIAALDATGTEAASQQPARIPPTASWPAGHEGH